MIVVSFGIIPHPTTFNVTLHSAFTIPAVGDAIFCPAPFGVAAAAVPTAGCPGATGTVPFGATTTHVGFGGNWQVVPKKHTSPRFWSCCLGVNAAAIPGSLPSNLRSNTGVASVTSPPAPVPPALPPLKNSKISGSVPSPIKHGRNGSVSAARAAADRFVEHSPGGFSGFWAPIEKPVITGCASVPRMSILQNCRQKWPVPSCLGTQPTTIPDTGSLLNLSAVDPSNRSNATALFPIGFAGFNGWFAFSSTPVPSSNRSIENVFRESQFSFPNSGTLIHLIRKSLIAANPSACTGNVFVKPVGATPPPLVLLAGLKSVHAAAIRGKPDLNNGTLGRAVVSPAPNVMFPFEFRKIPFHTPLPVPQAAPTWNTSPSGLANRNSNPPDLGPVSGAGLPAPSSSSPRNGNT